MPAAALKHSPERPTTGALLCAKYRLVQEIGSGGMGTVWLARNESLGKDVAVKMLRSDVESTDAAERFVREARAAACLDHPAIVRVFDYGTAETGQPFIVMERLNGESFFDVVERRQSIPALEAVRTLLPIVHGLAVAHEHGVVHRDLKPENIFLAKEAGQVQPKVLDFGVAKVESRETDLHLTRQGMIVGSPYYMSPEQARGLMDVDRRCDIWAMCVVLYEAVTGGNPFLGDNYNAVITSIVEQAIPAFPEAVGEEGLWDVLSLGLEKDRDHRFQSMRDLGEALALYLMSHGVHDDIRGIPLTTSWPALGAPEPEAPPRPRLSSGRYATVTPVEIRASAPTLIAPRVRRNAAWASAAVVAVLMCIGAGYRSTANAVTVAAVPVAPLASTPDKVEAVAKKAPPKPLNVRPSAAPEKARNGTAPPAQFVTTASTNFASNAAAVNRDGKRGASRRGLALEDIAPHTVPAPGSLDLKDPY